MREVWSLRREEAEGIGRRVRAEIGHWRRRYGVEGIRGPWRGYIKESQLRVEDTTWGCGVGKEKGWLGSIGGAPIPVEALFGG